MNRSYIQAMLCGFSLVISIVVSAASSMIAHSQELAKDASPPTVNQTNQATLPPGTDLRLATSSDLNKRVDATLRPQSPLNSLSEKPASSPSFLSVGDNVTGRISARLMKQYMQREVNE